jgi:hypothetical protein
MTRPGNLPGDTEFRWSVARQFVRTHGLNLEEEFSTRYAVRGRDGNHYSF